MAKTVNRLVRVGNDSHRHACIPKPGQNFAVKRIAVLTFVHNHFGEACRQSSTHRIRPIVAAEPPHHFHPHIGSAEIPASTQRGASTSRRALIREPIARDMVAQRLHSDCSRVDPVVRGVKEVETWCFAGECELAAQSDIDTERVPTVDHDGFDIDTVYAARRKQEVPQKSIERADKVRETQNHIQRVLTATLREFVNRGIRERQHRNAAAGSERRRDARNTRHDSSRLAGAWARFDKRTPGMTCDGALLLREIHASLIRAMA